MKANHKFVQQSLEFWANVKLISQKIGYTDRSSSTIKIPSLAEIHQIFTTLHLNPGKIIRDGIPTSFGLLLLDYFRFRAELLHERVEPLLMNGQEAQELFQEMKARMNPTCPLPMNKQTGNKKAYAYFTAIINMLIESNSKGFECDYDPRELTAFTHRNLPVRSLSRRVDGAFPGVINPIAIWEIKEYYYTTTFGSRIADGVYESLLDGYELIEARNSLKRPIFHYLMVDAYDTWWGQGKSYLCRICDMLHMGMLTEALFGKEVVTRIPQLVKEWKTEVRRRR